MPNWGEFENRRQASVEEAQPSVTFADLAARVLTTKDGIELLRHLYAITIDKRSRPGASDAELREHEAQRRLVHDLERLRDEGLERLKKG